MNKDKKCFGIDISKLVFDVTDSEGNYYQVEIQNHNNNVSKSLFYKMFTQTKHHVKE